MKTIFKDGLRKRKNFDQIIDYLQFHQEKIKYPDRTATNILNELTNNFSDFYNNEKELNNEKIQQMLMSNKQTQTGLLINNKYTQTKLFQDSGITFNIKNFREDYDKKLENNEYYLTGGSSNNFNNDKDIQTMHLRRNRMKYIKERIQALAPYLLPSLPSFTAREEEEPIPDYYVSPWDVADYLGSGISNVLFFPLDYVSSPVNSEHTPTPVNSEHDSPPISVHSSPPISIHSSPPISINSSSPLSIEPSEFPSPSPVSSSSSSSRRSRISR